MARHDSLFLEITLDEDHDLTVGEFISLFKWMDSLSKAIVLEEFETFIEIYTQGARQKREIRSRSSAVAESLPSPLEVLKVSRDSPWSVVGQLAGSSIGAYIINLLSPVVSEAWSEGRLRENIKTFLRDNVFLGAEKTVEQKSGRIRRYGNMKPVEVTTPKNIHGDGPLVRLTLHRNEIIEVTDTDGKHIDEIIRKLQK